MKRLIAPVAMAILFLSACTQSQPEAAPTMTGPPDYTVVAKNRYYPTDANASGKVGHHVTIVLFGVPNETKVSEDCFNQAVIGRPLSVLCR